MDINQPGRDSIIQRARQHYERCSNVNRRIGAQHVLRSRRAA
jgi:hypothetical protein